MDFINLKHLSKQIPFNIHSLQMIKSKFLTYSELTIQQSKESTSKNHWKHLKSHKNQSLMIT